MSQRKAILISNPKTGRYAARRKSIHDLVVDLNTLGLDVNLKLTTGPGDATRIASEATRNGTTDVIVAGGDGTINEVIQGMIGSNLRLGILPRGTANALARELGLPMDIKAALKIAATGASRRVHFGVAIDETNNKQRHFALMAGIGLDASVVRRVQPGLKKRIGKGAFWISGLSHLATWDPKPFTLEIEGKSYTATFAAIGKAARYGGDLMVTPRARLDEPIFEVCLIESSSRFTYLHLLSYVMREGMPQNMEGVRFIKTDRVRALGDAPVQVDGEIIGQLPMRFEISPHSLEVIVA
jgi:YegS/Rv2252/BmrU family lipid kinase